MLNLSYYLYGCVRWVIFNAYYLGYIVIWISNEDFCLYSVLIGISIVLKYFVIRGMFFLYI